MASRRSFANIPDASFLAPVHVLRPRSSAASDLGTSITPGNQDRQPSPSGGIAQTHSSSLDELDDEPGGGGPDLPVGESSVSGFIFKARSALQDHVSSNPTLSSHTNSSNNSSSGPKFSLRSWQNHMRSRQRLGACVEGIPLPPRKLADELLDRFWSHEYPLLPLLHRPSFLRKYEQVWNAPQGDVQGSMPQHIRGSFLCLLFVVLAMSRRRAENIQLKDNHEKMDSLIFFENSKQLLYSGLLESGSIEVVQALIYGASYLRRSGQHHEEWLFVGSAGRLSQALGFHLHIETGNQAQREIKRRLWYGAMQIDIFHTTVFGQALVTLNATLPLPKMIDDIYFETDPEKPDATQPDGIIPDIAFFIYQVKLSVISVGILRSICHSRYGSMKDIPDEEFFSLIIRFDMEIEQWINDRPDHWDYEKADEYPGELRLRQMTFLRVRELDCRFLFFRATVLRTAETDMTNKSLLQLNIAPSCLQSCVSAMRGIMAIFEKYRKTPFIPSPDHNVANLLIIATVLTLIVRSPTIRKMVGAEEHQSHVTLVTTCMQRLRSYDLSSVPRKRIAPVDAIDHLLRMETGAEVRERDEQFAQGQQQQQQQRQNTTRTTINPVHANDPVSVLPGQANAAMLTPGEAGMQMQPEFIEPLNPGLFNVSEFLGNLTSNLQNPQTWFGSGLEQFGAGFNDDFTMQGLTNTGLSSGWDGLTGFSGAGNEPLPPVYNGPRQEYGASLWNAPI